MLPVICYLLLVLLEVDSHCYLWSKIELNWAEAETACRKEGGHLASITSKAINDKISNETKTNHRGHTSMWIGGTDSEKEGTWKWSDCSEWKFELWMQVSEGNQPKKFDCVEFFREGVFWGDDDCTRKNYFLCSQKLCPGWFQLQKIMLSIEGTLTVCWDNPNFD